MRVHIIIILLTSALAYTSILNGIIKNLALMWAPHYPLVLTLELWSFIVTFIISISVLFSGVLLEKLPEGALKSWAACNRGCFIIVW